MPPAVDSTQAGAALRRLTDAYHAGELQQPAYRSQRRRLLEAACAGRALPGDVLEASGLDRRHARRVAFAVVALIIAIAGIVMLIGVIL